MLKSYGWWWWPIRFYCQPKSFGLDYGTLDFGLGLDNYLKLLSSNLVVNHNNVIVMERKLAKDETIQGHTK